MKNLLFRHMLKIVPVIFILIVPSLFALDIPVSGTMEGIFTYNPVNDEYYMKKILFPDTNTRYFLNNYLYMNGRVKLTNTGSTFGILDLDVKIDEMFLKESNIITQAVNFQLNEGYVGVKLRDDLVFNLGKKREVWGIAYSHNPSDFINPPKKITDPIAEKRGVYLADLEYFSKVVSLNPVVVIYDDLNYFGYGGKISSSALIPSSDINLIAYYSKNNKMNLGASFATTPFSEIDVLADLALHAETGFVQKSLRKPDRDNGGYYNRTIAGFNYFIPVTQTYVIGEYYYLEDGYSPGEMKDIADFKTNSSVIEPGNMGIHNFIVNLNQPSVTTRFSRFTDTLALSGIFLYDVLDGSYFLSGTAASSYVDNCVISLEYGVFTGAKGSDFSFSPVGSYVLFDTKIGF